MKDLSILDSLIIGRVEPHIYAFTTNTIPNYMKIGDTYRPVSQRLQEWEEHFPHLEKKYEGSAKISEDIYFRDFSVHSFLEEERHRIRLKKEDISENIYYSKEFFKEATVEDVEDAIKDIHEDFYTKAGRYRYYNPKTQLPVTEKYASTGMWYPRPNQQATIDAFKKAIDNGRTNLLMYAVMRFGKSFTSMCCAEKMNAKLVVVVSAKADVCDEWRKTVESAENFRNSYEFLSSADLKRNYNIVNEIIDNPTNPKKVVVFLTLQDLQGKDIKEKHAQIFASKIDLLLVDETHFGARAEKYGAVLRIGQGEKLSKEEKYAVEDLLESTKKFDANVTVHLSGTPYRILMSDEFDKEQDLIAFYQFTDIVKEQKEWDRKNFAKEEQEQEEEWENPYFGFPQMIRFAFNPNESSRARMAELRESGISDSFSVLFKPKSIKKAEDGSHKLFVYEKEILELFEIIDGSKEEEELLGFLDYNKIKSGKMCRHIVVVLPYCASCDALEALIKNNAEKFKNLNDYEIINISGVDDITKYKKPNDIKREISRFESQGKKTITLTVNRMLTGSTIPEWDTMIFLKDTESPQEYDQAIFRLQNQYVKEYISSEGETVKYNMKPQTLLVDFDMDRVFSMQEQKALIYNVNTEEAGNSKLSERIEKELSISPIITMNKDKVVQVTAANIMTAISEYSKTRGVAEETVDIPVDLSLLNIDTIKIAIERENELGSKAGFTIKNTEGEGENIDIPNGTNISSETEELSSENETGISENVEETHKEKEKDVVKQFRSYYARILFFAFLTKDIVISLSEILDCIDEENNVRIAKNLGINKNVLQEILTHADKFILSRLDYKIQNLNKLSHDDSLDPVTRASVAVQKFGKLGESEVITPKHICNDMIDMIDDDELRTIIDSGNKFLDIAGKAGEFALAICEKCFSLGYNIEIIKDLIYTIPTSGITYEFTRMTYEILGLNLCNIAVEFVSYNLLEIKDNVGNINYTKIANLLKQNKIFSTIAINDEVEEGDGTVKFDVIVGNPPYHQSTSKRSAQGKPIYDKFVDISKTIAPKFISMIIPSRWFAGGMGLDGFRDAMRTDLNIKKLVSFANGKDCFPDTSTGGICYFLRDSNYEGQCSFTSIINGEYHSDLRNLSEFPIILRDNIAHKIVHKMQSFDQVPLSEEVCSINVFGFESKKHGATTPFENGYELLSSKGIGYISDDELIQGRELANRYKVIVGQIISEHAAEPDKKGQYKLLSSLKVLPPKQICNFSYLVVKTFENEQEANNFKQYLSTKFVRYLILQAVSSIHLTKEKFSFVPLQDFSKTWTDRDLYEKYGLQPEEIAFIEAVIKPME